MLTLLLVLQATPSVEPRAPPVIRADCFTPGPYIVFFDRNSAMLGAEARAALDRFVREQADPCGAFRLIITGHTDRGERVSIDQRRAAAVRNDLARRGLRALIGPSRGMGGTSPRVGRPAGIEGAAEPAGRAGIPPAG